MGKIRRLDPQVINQIAAGEVVERPASVVKELVENSLDAGARRIRVDVEQGGLRAVVVTDDGSGMDPDDALLAVERHATSKITRLDDLSRAGTLGFRGEALAAIAAVARLELITRPAAADGGFRLVVEGGAQRAAGPWPSPPGTRVAVRDLFFNTPARRKHLKGPAAEFARIVDVLTAHALARPDVRFELWHDGREILRTSGHGDRAAVVLECFGPDVAGALIPIAASGGDCQVEGFVGAPRIARASRAWQFFSINRRPVQVASLRFSLENAYRHLLPARRYPVAVVEVTVPGDQVDVNVHPAKLEVRLVRERAVAGLLYGAVQQALASRDLLRPGSLPGDERGPAGAAGAAPGSTAAPGGLAPGDGAPQGETGGAAPRGETDDRGGAASLAWLGPGAPDAGERASPGAWRQGPPGPGEAVGEGEVGWPGEGGPGGAAAVPETGSAAGPAGPVPERAGVPPAWTRPGPFRPGAPRWVRGATWTAAGASSYGQAAAAEPPLAAGTPPAAAVSPLHGGPAGAGPAGAAKAGAAPGTAAWIEAFRRDPGLEGPAGAELLRRLQPLGQVAGTYLACAGPDGLYLVDQHAAHERVYFERFLAQGAADEGIPSQGLAVPVVLDLPASERALLVEHAPAVARLGFQVEPFGPRSVVVRAVPAGLAGRPAPDLLTDLLSRLLTEAVRGEGEGEGGAVLDTDRAARILAACKAAIKAGDRLHPQEMAQLLADLARCRQPYTCPHGRPTVIRLGVEELERRFGRRGG
ncbi:DNA mismatch repair endonuclease MutL [Thermaerobacter litoralis]